MMPEDIATYGLPVIKHAYNEGKNPFKEWLELSREWVLKIIEQYGGETALRPSPLTTATYSPTMIE